MKHVLVGSGKGVLRVRKRALVDITEMPSFPASLIEEEGIV